MVKNDFRASEVRSESRMVIKRNKKWKNNFHRAISRDLKVRGKAGKKNNKNSLSPSDADCMTPASSNLEALHALQMLFHNCSDPAAWIRDQFNFVLAGQPLDG